VNRDETPIHHLSVCVS